MPTGEPSNTPKPLDQSVDLPPEVLAEIDQYEKDLRAELDEKLGVVRNEQGEIVGARDGLKKDASQSQDSATFQETQHPRGPGGKFSNKPNAGSSRVPWWMKARTNPQDDPTGRRPHAEVMLNFIMEKSKKTAEKLGYDPNLVHRRDDESTFVLGGRQRYAAGLAYTRGEDKGRIDIFPHRLDPLSVVGLTAHEVMHHKWETIWNKYTEEKERALNLAASHMTRVNPVMAPDDSLKPPYDKQFPVYNAIHPLMGGGKDYFQMIEEDGVSQYSEDYWKEYEKSTGDKSVWLRSAFHETLAEIAKQDIETNGEDLKRRIRLRDGPWGRLYNAVNNLYASMNK